MDKLKHSLSSADTKDFVKAILEDLIYIYPYGVKYDSVLAINDNEDFTSILSLRMAQIYLRLFRFRLFYDGYPTIEGKARHGYKIRRKELDEIRLSFRVSLAKAKKSVEVISEAYEELWDFHEAEALKIMAEIKKILEDK